MANVTVGQRLPRQPLVHVIAQVRFTPIAGVSNHLDSLRRAFKGLGMPGYEASSLQQIKFGADGIPTADSTPRWDFFDLERRNGIVLTPEFVMIQTSRYEGFTELRDRFHGVLSALTELAGTEAVQRIGLRYIDLLRATEHLPSPKQLLTPSLQGFPADQVPGAEAAGAVTRSESLVPTAHGVLAVRCWQRGDGGFLPPDIPPTELSYDVALNGGESVIILDTDHFQSVPQMLFQADALVQRFDALHEVVSHAFWKAVSEEALVYWAKEGS
jgi:uncharacterized protein (TIGR04255 family)